MICSKCGGSGRHVLDSRKVRRHDAIRRRIECLNCGNRWTTYEVKNMDELQEKVSIAKRKCTKLLSAIEKELADIFSEIAEPDE